MNLSTNVKIPSFTLSVNLPIYLCTVMVGALAADAVGKLDDGAEKRK